MKVIRLPDLEKWTTYLFFYFFFAFSTFETKRSYIEKKPCGGSRGECPDNLDDFHNDNGEVIEKFYNQKSNQYFGLIDSFAKFGHYYYNSKNETFIVGCYAFHIEIEKCRDPKMQKDWTCEASVCLIYKKGK